MNKLVQKLKEFKKELEKNPDNEKIIRKSKVIEEEISFVKVIFILVPEDFSVILIQDNFICRNSIQLKLQRKP